MRRWFSAADPRGRASIALIACALCTPAIFSGFVLDDYMLARRLVEPGGGPRWEGLLDAFSFVRPGEVASLRERGELPWWSDPELAICFFRPLSALSHGLDFALFPRAPWLMHVESLALLFALNLSVGAWYAQLLGSSSPALSLAYLLYALAPGHGFAASWLANRNAVWAALFAVLALRAHDRTRRGEGARFQLLSLAALAASLLSSELGSSTLALMIAHAVCLDRGPRSRRARALAPAIALAAFWLVCHRSLGYGTRATPLYFDVANDPIGYLRALLTNVPILLFGPWVLPLISGTLLLSRTAMLWLAVLGVLGVGLFLPIIVVALRTDARVRFAGLAALLSLPPIVATLPHDRLLIIADIGGLLLLALAIEHGVHARPRLSRSLARLARTRLIASCLLSPLYAASLFRHAELSKQPVERMLRDPAVAEQSVIFVNPPASYYLSQLLWARELEGGPIPHRVRTLAPGIYALTLRRLDAHTLAVRAEHGILQPLGTWRADGERVGPVSQMYAAQLLSQATRADRPFTPGERILLSDVELTIVEVTAHGWPREVQFRFAAPLEHERWRLLRWHDGEFVRLSPPAVGERISLPALVR